MPTKTKITLSLTNEALRLLANLAAREGLSRSGYLEVLLRASGSMARIQDGPTEKKGA